MTARQYAVALMLAFASTTAFAQSAPQPPAQPPATPDEPVVYEEQVVVTASKVEQQLVNAPATMSVVTADVIASTPSTNYAELLRAVPGVNLAQTSARDYNITMRGAASTLATSTLALLDGRSLYLDFFGFVAWDLLPVNPNELKQIEVIRGPASAVWGANAMNGVVNFISKTPRELNGNSATMTFGTFGRDIDGGQQLGNGTLFGINATHARAVNDRWAYKISAGGYTSDPFARPTGAIPNGTGTPVPELHQPGHDPAEVRHPRRLRRRELQAGVRRRLLGHRRHFPHRHRPVRRHVDRRRLRHHALHPRRAQVQLLHQPVERRRQRPAGDRHQRPADPVQVQHQDLRLRARQHQHHRHPQRAELRRQRPLQLVRPVDCAQRRQPHRAGLLRPGRGVPEQLRPPQPRRPRRQVRQHRRPGVLAARRADPQADRRSRGAPVVQQGVPLAVADQQLPADDDHQPARPGADQPGVRGAARACLQLPGDRHRQRGPDRGIDRVVRSQLHRRHQQPRDGVGGDVLDDERGRDLLHAVRPLPRRQSAARIRAGVLAGRHADPAAAEHPRHPRSAAAGVRVARCATPAACRRRSAT